MAVLSAGYKEAIRVYVRVTDSDFDDEITDLINAARADMVMSGISETKANDENDSLIKRAVALYVKAEFGLDNSDSEKYQTAYVSLKRHLCISDDYKASES